MNLYMIYFQYGEHEDESTLFASETGSTTDAKRYLKNFSYIDDVKQLHDVTVRPLSTVEDSNGIPYRVKIR